MWKQRIIQAIWIMAGAGTLVLLVAAMQKKSGRGCAEVQVEISGAQEHVFVDEKDVKDILRQQGSGIGVAIKAVNLREIEEVLEKDPWIQNAELFFDNKQVLQVRITERQPVARVFTITGSSFYLDSAGKTLPLSEKLSARVPVFTSYPFSARLQQEDSLLLKDVLALAKYIKADSFWNAQVTQVDIAGREFDLVPLIGNHIIRFGNATDIDKKFKKLFSFYRNVSAKTGFEKYERINLEYDGQVVATKRGVAAPVADSASALGQLQQALGAQQAILKDTVTLKVVPSNAGAQNGQTAPKAVMTNRNKK